MGPNQNMEWKMTSKHKVYNVTEGEIGNLRGNLECGPAQPSLFIILMSNFHWKQDKVQA